MWVYTYIQDAGNASKQRELEAQVYDLTSRNAAVEADLESYITHTHTHIYIHTYRMQGIIHNTYTYIHIYIHTYRMQGMRANKEN
jgi:hypothetical protein